MRAPIRQNGFDHQGFHDARRQMMRQRGIGNRQQRFQQGRQRMNQARRWIKRYKPNDHAKRHRIQDDQPKTQRVVSYVRRT